MKRSLRALTVMALLVMVFSLFEVNLALAEANKVYYDLSLRTEEELNASMMTVTAGKTKMYDENNEVICTLTKDEIVYFVSMDGDFCYVIRKKHTAQGNVGGYVPLADLQFENFVDIMEKLGADIAKFAVKVTGDYVNMRAGIAGTKGHKEIVNWGSGLRYGETVYAYQMKNNWYKVVRKKTVNGKHQVGWVWGDFIDYTGPSIWRSRRVDGVPGSGESVGKTTPMSSSFKAVVKNDYTPLRQWYSGGTIISQYREGTVVTVLQYGQLFNGYVHVRIGNYTGYIDSKYLKNLD